jgi:hypothetical protein
MSEHLKVLLERVEERKKERLEQVLENARSERNRAVYRAIETERDKFITFANVFSLLDSSEDISESVQFVLESSDEEMEKLPGAVRDVILSKTENVLQIIKGPKARCYVFEEETFTEYFLPMTQEDILQSLGEKVYSVFSTLLKKEAKDLEFIDSPNFVAIKHSGVGNLISELNVALKEMEFTSPLEFELMVKTPRDGSQNIEVPKIQSEVSSAPIEILSEGEKIFYVEDLVQRYKIKRWRIYDRAYKQLDLAPATFDERFRYHLAEDVKKMDEFFGYSEDADKLELKLDAEEIVLETEEEISEPICVVDLNLEYPMHLSKVAEKYNRSHRTIRTAAEKKGISSTIGPDGKRYFSEEEVAKIGLYFDEIPESKKKRIYNSSDEPLYLETLLTKFGVTKHNLYKAFDALDLTSTCIDSGAFPNKRVFSKQEFTKLDAYFRALNEQNENYAGDPNYVSRKEVAKLLEMKPGSVSQHIFQGNFGEDNVKHDSSKKAYVSKEGIEHFKNTHVQLNMVWHKRRG